MVNVVVAPLAVNGPLEAKDAVTPATAGETATLNVTPVPLETSLLPSPMVMVAIRLETVPKAALVAAGAMVMSQAESLNAPEAPCGASAVKIKSGNSNETKVVFTRLFINNVSKA